MGYVSFREGIRIHIKQPGFHGKNRRGPFSVAHLDTLEQLCLTGGPRPSSSLTWSPAL